MNQPKMIWDLPPGGILGLKALYIFLLESISPKNMLVLLPFFGSYEGNLEFN
jgi:hypothetical protein